MVYTLLKIYARLALKIFCRDLFIYDKSVLRSPGPILFAANHPNSFLDAVIIAAHTRSKTYILVRGDVFENKWANACLRYFGCIPIYRRRDGRKMLGQNTLTYQECMLVFEQGHNILIFSEGICENEWTLRPLGKGTARLAFMGWQSPAWRHRLKVIPTGFTYSHFEGIGKKVWLLTNTPVSPEVRDGEERKDINAFNNILRDRLNDLILQFSGVPHHLSLCQLLIENTSFFRQRFNLNQVKSLQEAINMIDEKSRLGLERTPGIPWHKIILSPLAAAGWLLHFPFYYPLNALARSKTKGTVYYDSVLFGLLFLLYPLYVALISCVITVWTKNYWCMILLVALPLLAWLTTKAGFIKRK